MDIKFSNLTYLYLPYITKPKIYLNFLAVQNNQFRLVYKVGKINHYYYI